MPTIDITVIDHWRLL